MLCRNYFAVQGVEHCFTVSLSVKALDQWIKTGRVMTASSPEKLLFVCSRNRWRSLTAEKLFEGSPRYQVRSAGTQPNARIVVNAGHIGWADTIFCMEKSHMDRLRRKFPEAIRGKRLICLHVRDEFEFMDPDLLDEFKGKLAPYVTFQGEDFNV